MIRISALLFFLLIGRAHADMSAGGTSGGSFDPALTVEVYQTALTFMAPRILEPVPIPQMTLWGLRGLAAMDPALATEQRDGRLRLLAQGRVLFDAAVPKEETPRAWAQAAVSLSEAAVAASAIVRKAGTTGVVQNFFDELFNHLDPYSRYVPPPDAAEDRERRSGKAGLGMSLTLRGGAVVAWEVISDGPAAAAGVRVGDAILSVDGRSTNGRDSRTVNGWIAGPEDTAVRVSWRGRDGRSHAATLIRAMVPPETVFSSRVDDMLIIRLTGFSNSTDVHLSHTVHSGLSGAHPPQGIVLDLRGNRGGLLRQAVTVASMFLSEGIVTRTAGRDPDSDFVWRSPGAELAEDMPVVVVVDGRTASAAEVLAAALADRGRAVVVGSSTLGKGLVQTISPLPDGGELFVTWSRLLAPRGWPIQGLGVLPQVCTSLGADRVRTQLANLAQGGQAMGNAVDTERAARAPLTPGQMLAIRNACPAAEGRDIDMEVARVLIDNPAAFAAALLPPMSVRRQSLASPAN